MNNIESPLLRNDFGSEPVPAGPSDEPSGADDEAPSAAAAERGQHLEQIDLKEMLNEIPDEAVPIIRKRGVVKLAEFDMQVGHQLEPDEDRQQGFTSGGSSLNYHMHAWQFSAWRTIILSASQFMYLPSLKINDLTPAGGRRPASAPGRALPHTGHQHLDDWRGLGVNMEAQNRGIEPSKAFAAQEKKA